MLHAHDFDQTESVLDDVLQTPVDPTRQSRPGADGITADHRGPGHAPHIDDPNLPVGKERDDTWQAVVEQEGSPLGRGRVWNSLPEKWAGSAGKRDNAEDFGTIRHLQMKAGKILGVCRLPRGYRHIVRTVCQSLSGSRSSGVRWTEGGPSPPRGSPIS